MKQKVNIQSAQELKEAQQKKIRSILEEKYGQELEFEWEVEPELIGGFKLSLGSIEYDASLKNKLIQLEEKLLARL